MLVFIESFYGNRLLTGKRCSEKELWQRMKCVVGKIEKTEDFTPLFCRLYEFDELPMCDDTEVDFVIDLDTCLVYSPQYGYGELAKDFLDD